VATSCPENDKDHQNSNQQSLLTCHVADQHVRGSAEQVLTEFFVVPVVKSVGVGEMVGPGLCKVAQLRNFY
jgi:hypothetical protein